MLITLSNLNHLGYSFLCQVSFSGWVFCFALLKTISQNKQTKKKSSDFSEKMARERLGMFNTIVALSLKGLESSYFRERTKNFMKWKSCQNWGSKIALKALCRLKKHHWHLCNSIFPVYTLPFTILATAGLFRSVPSEPHCTQTWYREPSFHPIQLELDQTRMPSIFPSQKQLSPLWPGTPLSVSCMLCFSVPTRNTKQDSVKIQSFILKAIS